MIKFNRLVVIGSKPSSLYNFRGNLIKCFIKLGFDVIGLAPQATNEEIERINHLGADFLNYNVSRNGLNPKEDIKTYLQLRSIFKKLKPNVVLAYTIKPIIWGGLASRVLPNCSFYALITGLGFAFQKGNWKKNLLVWLVSFLYKYSLKNADRVIFQNPDDCKVFIDNQIIPEHKAYIVNGSGVDVSHFDVKPLTKQPRFLLIARLLGDKGIREYITAANIVKDKHPNAYFQLVGPEDSSPNGISLQEISELNFDQAVDYLGATKDVRPYIENSNIFVLPSYHEGLPRTVLEAMATGRPILTTDVPGCRETVLEGINGFLVAKGNVEQLAEKMVWFIENQQEWQAMGEASRAMVEEKFDVHKVNYELLKIMKIDNIYDVELTNKEFRGV
ncbi:glycosyltransferase family 4 protein [Vibrio alginolyticus]|nr:glycosyltransferase family 4 protein [Vibrio alginolyticus]